MSAAATLLVGALFIISTPANAAESTTSRVRHVIDGDTLVLENGDHVRLIGVDAPEFAPWKGLEEPFGKEASDFLKRLAEGRTVRLEADEEKFDRYGRALSYVWMEDGTMANRRLIEEGMARVYFVPPNGAPYRGELEAAEKKARDASLGLWSAGKN